MKNITYQGIESRLLVRIRPNSLIQVALEIGNGSVILGPLVLWSAPCRARVVDLEDHTALGIIEDVRDPDENTSVAAQKGIRDHLLLFKEKCVVVALF